MEAEVDIFQKNDKMLDNVNKKHLELVNLSSNIKAENDKIRIPTEVQITKMKSKHEHFEVRANKYIELIEEILSLQLDIERFPRCYSKIKLRGKVAKSEQMKPKITESEKKGLIENVKDLQDDLMTKETELRQKLKSARDSTRVATPTRSRRDSRRD